MKLAEVAVDRHAPRVLMLVNVSWFFVSHRLRIAEGARDAGFDFHLATRFFPASDQARIHALGIRTHKMPFARGGLKLVADARSLFAISALYSRLRPDIVHLVTLKMIIVGGVLARIQRVPAVVAAVPGLGYSFVAKGPWATIRRRAVILLLKLALRGENCAVIFQNPEDRNLLIRAGVVLADKTVLIRGAGVDMAEFQPTDPPTGPVRILMASRMLREKGVVVFLEAARMLRAQGVLAEFLLAGSPDPDNPGSVSEADLKH
jgi:glycosyltransferase involved in cell wall biosynthesis